MEAVGGRVGDVRDTEDTGLAPAAGGDLDVRTGLDAAPRGDGQRFEAEAVGAYESQAEGGQRSHVGGGHDAAAVPGGAQDEPGQAVDRFVTGDHRALVVGGEPRAPGAAGQVVDTDQGVVGGAPRRLVRPARLRPGARALEAVTGPLSHPAARRLP